MADQPKDDAKQSFPLDLSRRQFLQGIGFVAGAGAALADGLLRYPQQVEAAQPQVFAQARQTRDSIADIWGNRTPIWVNGRCESMNEPLQSQNAGCNLPVSFAPMDVRSILA